METILREQIVSHMMENSLFCDEQHGFVPGRSCMTQLLITIELLTDLLDTGAPLDAYGIGGPIKEWIKSFLMNRKQSYSKWNNLIMVGSN